MKTNYGVSVIIRTHNRPYFLEKALHSLLIQESRDFEVIVVEDGPPNSHEIIQLFKELNIRYIPTYHNVGRTKAANIGLSNAVGKYINFLDDDDLLLPNHITDMLKTFKDNPDFDVIHARSLERTVIYQSNTDFVKIKSETEKYYRPFNPERIFFENMFPIQAVMFKRQLFLDHGGMDEKLDLLEDWDLWIKYSMFAKFYFLNKVTSIYHVPGNKRIVKDRKQKLIDYESNITNKYQVYVAKKGYKSPKLITKLIEKTKQTLTCLNRRNS